MSKEKMPKDQDAEGFVKKFALIHQKMFDEFNGTMIVNPGQHKKFKRAIEISENLVRSESGKFIRIDENPPECHGWISIEIPMMDLWGNKLDELKELIDCVDGFSIELSMNGGLIIGVNVNYIWIRLNS